MGMSRIDRRLVLAALGAAAVPAMAHAATRDYRGWTIDDDALPGGLNGETWASLKAQIDLVESVRIKPEITSYWRSQRLIMDPTLKEPGRAGPMRLFLSPEPQPHENPVLLHELIHVYHFNKVPGGRANPELIGFYEAAKRSGWYPPQAYVLKNVIEFFAMNASVVIWGKAARPPFKRETVQHNQPDLYAWIVDTFGLTV
jgi:hypothetical protein